MLVECTSAFSASRASQRASHDPAVFSCISALPRGTPRRSTQRRRDLSLVCSPVARSSARSEQGAACRAGLRAAAASDRAAAHPSDRRTTLHSPRGRLFLAVFAAFRCSFSRSPMPDAQECSAAVKACGLELRLFAELSTGAAGHSRQVWRRVSVVGLLEKPVARSTALAPRDSHADSYVGHTVLQVAHRCLQISLE